MNTATTTYVTVSTRDRSTAMTVPAHELADTLLALDWGTPDPTPEITNAVNGLAAAVVAGKSIHEFVGHLGVDFGSTSWMPPTSGRPPLRRPGA